jgi:radical SAM/Cys-rich protein
MFRRSAQRYFAREEVLSRIDTKKNLSRKEFFVNNTQEIPTFNQKLKEHSKFPLKRSTTSIFQVNIGKLCNLSCHHCHVESGPTKTKENMDKLTIERCLEVLRKSPTIKTVDITGGAPEMNKHFKYFVSESKKLGKQIMDRCNLTIFYEKGFEDLAPFLAEQKVHIVASLPCYTLPNVEKQRGKGVFNASIEALKLLNSLGYGESIPLSLVYNPGGPNLPGDQKNLENDYKRELFEHFGVTFNDLYTITNMPIKRFADDLILNGKFNEYMELLVNNFNAKSVDGLMCKNTINVAW